ncbi:MAG: protein serine/threonine phosphatase [Myxococcales bacterium]|nr:protein serine/threonine phosphatase [Myxococcales bacterium]
MSGLAWSWLAAPYLGCAAVILAIAIAASLIRGDRVLRVGVISASVTAVPWALCQGLAACTDDAQMASHLLRLGNGPVAMVGPNLMLVLLAVSGQLERHRWIARIAGLLGMISLVLCWTTNLIVPGVQRLRSGMFYIEPGPLTAIHISQLLIWLAVGLLIVRRSSPRGERRRSMRLLLGILVAGAIGSVDTLLLYRVWGVYPIAWFPATVAACISLYLVVRTDFLRPQGFDRGTAIELGGFAVAAVATSLIAVALPDASPLVLAALAALAWVTVTAATWTYSSTLRVRGLSSERALEQFVARVALLDDDNKIAERTQALWAKSLGIELRAMWWIDGDALARIGGAERRALDPDVIAWLVGHAEALAITDLATMRLGPIRPKVEALGANGAGIIVPLVDRGELVGLVEANHDKALRDEDRSVLAESAHAVARALTFVVLARAASRERETAREVEVADALRLQASASRDAELGNWAVAAEYRTAPKTTGAGWSATELADGRLAVLVTEAQAHGVAAALATAALTGAFAAATIGDVTLDELLVALQASADGVMRGGEPVAAFLAVLDAKARTIEWACAGHPGGFLVGPVASIDASPLGSVKGPRPSATPLAGTARRARTESMTSAKREASPLPRDCVLVVASSALRGDDDARWQALLRETAPAAGRLATVLVETALRAGEPREDLLAVVVRSR